MDINSWLTVITVFIAVLAFFPKEERLILQYKLNKREPAIVIITLGVIIPYLILFPILSHRLKFLNVFTFEKGFASANIAFGIFYILFAWLLIRLFLINPKKQVDKRTINYFGQLLNELPFNRFFSLFTKYTSKYIPDEHLKLYAPVFFNSIFLKGVVQFQSDYLPKIWRIYNNEDDFRKLMNLFISDSTSAYYTEIKLHTDSNEVLANAPFLQTVLVKNLKQSMDNKILPLIYDTTQKLLRTENKENSIYIYRHEHQFIREEEGFDLPIYYHIKFIGLMYSNAIYNKVDIGDLSTFNGHMRTLFSEMIGTMIKQLPLKNDRNNQTNYHWLIDETFSIISNWLEIFGGQHPLYPEEYENGGLKFGYVYFNSNSSYLYFIPQCLSNCFKKLCQEVDEGKISQQYLNSKFHYYIMSDYYKWYALDEIKTQIEDEIIGEIPKNFLPELLDFSLDEEFASDYSSFRENRFRGVNDKEFKVQDRLWNFLNQKKLLI